MVQKCYAHFGASDDNIVCWLIKYVHTVYYLLWQFNGKNKQFIGDANSQKCIKVVQKVNHDCHQRHQNFAYTIDDS